MLKIIILLIMVFLIIIFVFFEVMVKISAAGTSPSKLLSDVFKIKKDVKNRQSKNIFLLIMKIMLYLLLNYPYFLSVFTLWTFVTFLVNTKKF